MATGEGRRMVNSGHREKLFRAYASHRYGLRLRRVSYSRDNTRSHLLQVEIGRENYYVAFTGC